MLKIAPDSYAPDELNRGLQDYTAQIANLVYDFGKAKFLNILEVALGDEVMKPKGAAFKRLVEDTLSLLQSNIFTLMRNHEVPPTDYPATSSAFILAKREPPLVANGFQSNDTSTK